MANDPHFRKVASLLKFDGYAEDANPHWGKLVGYATLTASLTPELGTFVSSSSAAVSIADGRSCAVLATYGQVSFTAASAYGAHTIEFDVYVVNTTTAQALVCVASAATGSAARLAIGIASGQLTWVDQDADLAAAGNISVGWHTIALSYDGKTVFKYLDGVLVGTDTVVPGTGTAAVVTFGYKNRAETTMYAAAGTAFRNFRFYKGVALYTTPTYDLDAAGRQRQSDAAGSLWFDGGATTLEDGALVLDGSSYLHCPGFNFGSADFTIEGWFNYTGAADTWPRLFNQSGSKAGKFWNNISSDGRFVMVLQGSLSTVGPTRAFGRTTLAPGPHHIALVRKGNAACVFVDGVAEFAVVCLGEISAANRFAIGTVSDALGSTSNFVGTVDDFRVTLGKARYDFTLEPNFFNTVFIERPNGTSYPFTNNNRNKLVTQGNAVAILEEDPFGGTDYMLRLNGTSSYASIPTHADFNFGAGDFTVEWWGKNSGTTAEKHCVFASGNTTWGAGAVGIYQNGAFVLLASYENGDPVVTASGDYSVGWHHFVVERIGGVARIYVDGVLSASAACAAAINFGTTITYFGKSGWSTTQNYNGDITDFRVTKGVARYDADFTPSRIVEVTGSFTPPPVGSLPSAATAISGVVRGSDNNPCERKVFAYSHETGRYLGTATSDPVTGAFSIDVPERAFAVALDTDASGQNALVLDRLDPV